MSSTYSETQTDALPDVDADLESAFIAAVAANPACYTAVQKRLPTPAVEVFAVHRPGWDRLVAALRHGAPTDDFGTPPHNADVMRAADRLTELHRRRVLASVAQATLRDLAVGKPSRQIINVIRAEIAELQQVAGRAEARDLTWGDELVDVVMQELAAADANRLAGQLGGGVASSGLPSLDLLLNGWQRGALYVLGGAPGIGKTSLALQWACEAISARGAVVTYVTYENSPQNLTLKAIGRLAGIPPTAAERGRANPVRWAEGIERFRMIAPHLALIPADAGTSVDVVESVTREALRSRPAADGIVIIDYLQRMAYGERFESLKDNIAVLAQRLRDLAGRLDLPVLALSALAPSENEAPLRLSALAQRGELEYASDVVMLLGPRADTGLASAERVRTSPTLRLIDLLVAKNRYGEANRTIPLLFRPGIAEFQEESPHA